MQYNSSIRSTTAWYSNNPLTHSQGEPVPSRDKMEVKLLRHAAAWPDDTPSTVAPPKASPTLRLNDE